MTARRQALLLLLPAALTLFVLFVLPQALMFEASLGRRSAYGGIVHEWSFANYARALEPLYLGIFARSVGLAALTTGLCLALAWPVAWWIAFRVPQRHKSALLVLLVLPFWTSFLVRMYAWIVLLRTEGVINAVGSAFGLPAFDLLYNDLAVLIGQVYGELPFMALPLYASMEKLDRRLLEAAADLGASPLRRLREIALPLTLPGIAAGAVLVFIPSLGAYLAPDLLGGAKGVYVGNLVQSQFAVARDAPFGAALSFVLALLVFVAVAAARRPLAAARSL